MAARADRARKKALVGDAVDGVRFGKKTGRMVDGIVYTFTVQ